MSAFTLTAGLPGGRTFTFRCTSPRIGASALRRLARRLGVSPAALDWSVEPRK